jgi:hypothetical protein
LGGLGKLDGRGFARPAEGLATTEETLATSPSSGGPDRRYLSESADPSSQQQPNWSERHLSHILKMSKSTRAPKLKKSGPYKYFVPMSIGGVICKAMVDSGNLWKNVPSLDFLHQLGLTHEDLREVPGIQEVGTAKSGTGLKVVEELKTPIHLRFGGCATRFKCRPVVPDGLSMPFILSGPFFAQFGINQLHSEGALLVQGKKIPLVASHNPSADVEQTVSNLYLIEKVTVPAFSETKFVVRASAVEGGTMSPGDGIATRSVHFSNRHDLHPFLNVVRKCD